MKFLQKEGKKIVNICHIEEPSNAILIRIFVILPHYTLIANTIIYIFICESAIAAKLFVEFLHKKQINVFRNVYKTPLLLYTLSFSHTMCTHFVYHKHSNNKIFDPFIRTRLSSENNNAPHHPS